MQTRKTVSIVDIDEKTIPNSGGIKEKFVSNGKTLTLNTGIVGQNTYWNAKVSNVILSNSIEIRAALFNNEKWCFFDNKTYEIVNVGKAKEPSYIILNVKENNDGNVKTAIEKWVAENEQS